MKAILTIALLSVSLLANAQLIQNFSGGDNLNVGPGTAGYEFTVGSTPITIQGLGLLATLDTGTLSASHEVGLWDTTPQRNLLGSVTVTPGNSSAINGFWYVNLASPLTLSAGTHYVLAAQYSDVDFDQVKGNVTSVTMSGATLGNALLSSGTGFGFPDIDVSGANLGFIGPNAAFTVVPESAGTALAVGFGLVALAVFRRISVQSKL